MPIVNGENISPDAALRAARCPECGKKLSEVSQKFHAAEHWPMPIPHDSRHAEAARRRDLLTSALEAEAQGRS